MGISGFCVFLYINFLLLDKRPADADEEQKPKKKVGATARFLAENTADMETSGLKKKLKRTVSNEELATLTSIRCEQLVSICHIILQYAIDVIINNKTVNFLGASRCQRILIRPLS